MYLIGIYLYLLFDPFSSNILLLQMKIYFSDLKAIPFSFLCLVKFIFLLIFVTPNWKRIRVGNKVRIFLPQICYTYFAVVIYIVTESSVL